MSSVFVRCRHAVALVALIGLLGGCASAPEPTVLKAQLLAGPEVNPTPEGLASPVVVRVYILRNAGAFEGADFFSLYDRDQAVLKDDLMGKEEFQMLPGGVRRLNKKVPPEARFIGVLAAFRDVDHATWRAVYPLQPQQVNPVTVALGRHTVSIGEGVH
jgi:type VI secretion system protein VasD